MHKTKNSTSQVIIKTKVKNCIPFHLLNNFLNMQFTTTMEVQDHILFLIVQTGIWQFGGKIMAMERERDQRKNDHKLILKAIFGILFSK